MAGWNQYKRGGKDMKRSIEFKHFDGKFVLAENNQILFEINDNTLKFDSLNFYNGIYKDRSSAIDISNSTAPNVKSSTYIFNWMKELIGNIAHELNDNESDDNEVHDEATTISATSVEMDTNIIRVIPLYDLAVCAGDGDFVDETIGHEDFRTENEEADYALTISGESMEPTIPNGSIVLVKSVAELSNNDIAIVSTGSEAMCKRYIKRGRGEYLKPDNPKFKEFSKRDYKTFLIRGKVIDILKP